MSVIEVEDFSFKYEGSDFWAVKNINFKLEEGELVLITGPSGCGKSTLCRAFNGLIPHFYSGEYRGSVRVLGHEVKETPTYELARFVSMVFQNPENQLFASTVEREIAFGLENLGLSRDEIRERLEEVLEIIGIRDLRKRAPFELSGGQQQKVAIASVIAMRPKILIMDEPTANLDPVSALEVFQLLLKLRRELSMTIIVVEHRLELISSFVDRIIVMNSGQIVLDGSPRQILVLPEVQRIGIGVPKIVLLCKRLREKGVNIPSLPLTPEEFAEEVNRYRTRQSY
ncbi:MAG: ABC transporter ATP-binding protein [Thermoprotei archaeon]|nr:MAG: ABC transporter ATP-binding protein [Thermoprotei archaeon]RLE82992.1 MAG: ABC transporter ATP-binding protein [Thermoprotei archaeon]RLF02653.1 MAG: ABC transporter ATP-binding protein [Thermoprotei archaeon]